MEDSNIKPAELFKDTNQLLNQKLEVAKSAAKSTNYPENKKWERIQDSIIRSIDDLRRNYEND